MKRTSPRAVLGAALLLSAVTNGTALAVPARPGVLALSGNGTGSVEVTFARTVTVAPMLVAPNGAADGWSATGCGGVRGFYLRPVTGDPMAGVGAVDLAELRYGAANDLPIPGDAIARASLPLGRALLGNGDGQQYADNARFALPAGRYRAFLIGEGACMVRVPLGGLSGTVRATTKRAVRMAFAVRQLDGPDGALPAAPAIRAGAAAMPLTVRPDTFAVAWLHRVAYQGNVGLTSATAYETCVEAGPSPRCAQDWGVLPLPSPTAPSGSYRHATQARPTDLAPAAPVPVLSPFTSVAHDVGAWYAPGRLAPGALTAKVVAASVPATSLQAAMFALDLG